MFFTGIGRPHKHPISGATAIQASWSATVSAHFVLSFIILLHHLHTFQDCQTQKR